MFNIAIKIKREMVQMNSANIQHLIAMVIYMLAVVVIGIYFAKKANKNAES